MSTFQRQAFIATFEQDLANKVSSAYSWSKGGVTYNYTYDSRANILSDGFVSAGYDAVCQNPKTCNQPNWTRDAKGNETDYVYDPQHGGVLSITSPADANGIRPQTRFAYVQRYAWFLNASGQMVRSTDPVWKLASQSICNSGAAAAGGGCAIRGRRDFDHLRLWPGQRPQQSVAARGGGDGGGRVASHLLHL